MKYTTFFACIIGCFTIVKAQSPDNTTTSQQYPFLLFSARAPTLKPLSAGHAFVSFGVSSLDYKPARIKNTYGFYPCEGCNMLNTEKPGRVVHGFWKNRNKKKLNWLALSADTACSAATQKIIDQWSAVKYNLFKRNCVKFISEVAKAQGLKTPRINRLGIFPKFPHRYIHELKEANTERVIRLSGISHDGLPVELDENKNNIPDLSELELSNNEQQ